MVKILEVLSHGGKEPDQRLRQAIEMASPAMSVLGEVTSAHILEALCRLNTRGTAALSLENFKTAFDVATSRDRYLIPKENRVPLEDVIADPLDNVTFWRDVMSQGKGSTVGASDFLKAVVRSAERSRSFEGRVRAGDILAQVLTGSVEGTLDASPAFDRLRQILTQSPDGSDDFQYALMLQEERMVFRIVSTLDDYVQESDTGLWVPQRALLTHLGRVGLFTKDEVEELEFLINDPKATEAEFQKFFERHPHFLRKWDHREVFPHVYLTSNDQGPLIPDFILTNVGTQDAAIIDIKRTLRAPTKRLIRHQDNRVRFADAVQEAYAQLRTYRRWFEVPENRKMLTSKLGMEIYNPRLMVIIGRTSEFRDSVERARLRADNPDVEIVTYDDILRFAQARMVFIERG